MLYLLILLAACIPLYFFIRWTPQGMVEFRSGLVLKFLPSLDNMPPKKVRIALEKYVASRVKSVNKSLPVKEVRDMMIPTRHGDIRARLYNNTSTDAEELIVFFHGGGWCIGSIESHNEQTRRLAIATDLPVLSINYSLSPEVKFPHALEECVDAVKWAIEHHRELNVSKPQVVPMGDSAGGNLAITTTIQCIKDGLRDHITRVVPIYPVVDGRGRTTESHKLFAKGYYLTAKAMDNFTVDYLNDISDAQDPRTSPLLEEDLSFFPPCFILTAGFDPLRDEGEAFAEKLKSQGVDVTLKRYANALHAFFGIKSFGQKGIDAVYDIAKYLKGESISL
jgi:acetyl esterase